jgi:hypothetical protein
MLRFLPFPEVGKQKRPETKENAKGDGQQVVWRSSEHVQKLFNEANDRR